jgi:putative N6-adenine-specific DNA methylase
MVEMAKRNAQRVGFDESIVFRVWDFREFLEKKIEGTLVSNPPYGTRLQSENLRSLYNSIDKLFRLNSKLKWGVISSYMEFDGLIKQGEWKKRKLYNGAEMCYFWRKL